MMINEQNNADSIARFHRYIAEQKPLLKKHYEHLLAQDLSRQQWDGCFQRNVLAVLEQAYDQALAYLKTLAFNSVASPVTLGLSDLSKQALAAFDGYVDEFLLLVVDRHRSSCALSNFPGEHKPDKVYIDEVRRDIAGLWHNFALDVNAYILECR
jgi:monoamine oxidase